MALSGMSTTLKSIIDVIGPSKAALLMEEQQKLDARCFALKVLSTILPSLEGKQITIDDPFLAVESIVDLLHALVKQGAFKLASCLQTCDLVKHKCTITPSLLNPDVIASSALHIPMNKHPRYFIPWLCDDVVLPSLYIGHPLLGQIRSWTCSAADYYDEENDDLDSSILLLSVSEMSCSKLLLINLKAYPCLPQFPSL